MSDTHDNIIFDPAKAPGVPEDVRNAVSVWPQRLSPVRALKDRVVTRWIAKLCEAHLPRAQPQLLHFMSILAQVDKGHDFVSAGRTHGLDAKAARALFDQGVREAREIILTGHLVPDPEDEPEDDQADGFEAELVFEGVDDTADLPTDDPDEGADLLALGLSGRAVDALLRFGIASAEGIVADDFDPEDLRSLKGVGDATVTEIKECRSALICTGMSPKEIASHE